MKSYLKIMGCLVLFICGAQVSFAQQTAQRSEQAMKQEIIDQASAKKQTFDLHRLVGLNGDQTAQVHDLFLEMDKKMKELSTLDEGKRPEQLNALESEKNERLKKLLNETQYETYLKSINKE